MADAASSETPQLLISAEKVFRVASKTRQFEVKDLVSDPNPASNGADDRMVGVLEDRGDDPAMYELVSMIQALNEDEKADLVALAWLGRGDGDLSIWGDLRAEAARAHNTRTAQYLLTLPMLADYLEEGLALFGHSPTEVEQTL